MGTTVATEKSVKAIRQRALEIGYVKNSAAAGLALGRQNVIAVYIHQHGVAGSGIAEGLVLGIAGEARRRQQRLILNYFGDMSEFDMLAADINRNQMDHVILIGVMHKELIPRIERIRKQDIRVATMMDCGIHPSIANFGVNQSRIGESATQHLIEHGCRNIAHIKAVDYRYDGYRKALEAGGLAYRPELVYDSGLKDFSYEAGKRGATELMARGHKIDGIVAQSDLQALGAMHMLLSMNVRIPEDVKIIGVDNSPFCTFSIVPMSSVSQEDQKRGALVVQKLLKSLDGEPLKTIEIDPVVCARRSTE